MKRTIGVIAAFSTVMMFTSAVPAYAQSRTTSTVNSAAPNEYELARAALLAAEAAGAPNIARDLYDEARSKMNFAEEAARNKKRSVREDGRVRAIEARDAARAAEAKARLVMAQVEARNLSSDIVRFGGTSIERIVDGSEKIYRGATSVDRVDFAQRIYDRARAAGAVAVAAEDMKTAEAILKTARRLAKSDKQSETADHLAYRAEMLSRRAEYIVRRTDVDSIVPDLRLQRTRLAQAASEAAAAEERRRREDAEARAAELRAQLEAEAQNRRAEQAEIARLRLQVEENQRQIRDQLERDRTARVDAERNLDRLMAQYESSLRNASEASKVEELRRQVEDQQIALRSVQERERSSEQSLTAEVGRLKSELERQQSQGQMSAEVLAERQKQLATQQEEVTRLRTQREEAERLRAEAEKTHQMAISEAEARRRAAEVESAQLRAQVEQTQAELSKARQEIAKRDATEQERFERMQKALGELAETRSDTRGFIVTLPGIFFDSGKAVLKSGSKNTLTKIAAQLRGVDGVKITVEGHTDSVGDESGNQALSERRANAVRDHMVSAGVDAAAVTVVGQGESAPVATNDTAAGRQQNRRVELIINE